MIKHGFLLFIACIYIGHSEALTCKSCFAVIDEDGNDFGLDTVGFTSNVLASLGLPQFTVKCGNSEVESLTGATCPLSQTDCELNKASAEIAGKKYTIWARGCSLLDTCKAGAINLDHPWLKPFAAFLTNIKGTRYCCTGDDCNSSSREHVSFIMLFGTIMLAIFITK